VSAKVLSFLQLIIKGGDRLSDIDLLRAEGTGKDSAVAGRMRKSGKASILWVRKKRERSIG
jgi:hypothetical protein